MYKKDHSYCDISFSRETPQEDFFLYESVNKLYAKCEKNKNKVIKVRTVGTLRNEYGCFFIQEMFKTNVPSKISDASRSIQVSMAYMTKSIGCANMPYPVQLFGQLQWCKRPVIFAQILLPLNVSIATCLYEALTRSATLQASNHYEFDHSDDLAEEMDHGGDTKHCELLKET